MGHTCDLCLGQNTDRCPNNPGRCREEPEDDEPKMFHAYNTATKESVRVTESAWLCLPEDEDEAERRNMNYCRHHE